MEVTSRDNPFILSGVLPKSDTADSLRSLTAASVQVTPVRWDLTGNGPLNDFFPFYLTFESTLSSTTPSPTLIEPFAL